MGSSISGVRALGWDHRRMVDVVRSVFTKQNPLKEFTLPLVSLLKSRGIDSLLRATYGEVLIEDLWTTCFCTSSNLHTCRLKVHRQGPLWRAIRASCSLPGIMAPMTYNGAVHIDGGFLNNLPCDVMRGNAGFVIAVDVDTYSAMAVDFEEFPSAGSILWRRISASSRRWLGLACWISRARTVS